jgi:DNA invertase Pin-like site-specific DNA recombinase
MAVYGYVRVSTRQQVEEGLSLEAQERQLRGYGMMKGLDIDRLYVERAVSGWKPIQQRPEGRKLISGLVQGDVVLCAKLDRMFRSAKDALDVADLLKKRGVSLHLLDLGGDITGNGISKVFFTIVAAFAEFERDRIAERISDVKANEKQKGRYLGGARPFGWHIVDGTLAPNPEEQGAIKEARKLRASGQSLRSIAGRMTKMGYTVSHVTIGKILDEE